MNLAPCQCTPLSFPPLLILNCSIRPTSPVLLRQDSVYMPVFPSTFSNGLPRRTDSLNATQQKPASHAVFGAVEEDLHDAKRVEKDGQEDDLRYALGWLLGV
jgi:hypothetical protein